MNRLILATIFVLECFALPSQFYLLVSSPAFTFLESIVRFFSYFTVLTNSLVAICSSMLLFGKGIRLQAFIQKDTTLTAVTVYILVVGLVYNIILRPLQELEGLHRVNTEIFHTIVPLLFLLNWWLYVPKQHISWKSTGAWLIYPLIYVIYTLVHGKYSGFYPYPFIDIGKLGFAKAMTNGVYVLLSFVVLSALLISVGKLRKQE